MAKLESGRLQAHTPVYSKGELAQSFTFRCGVVIGKRSLPQILESVVAQFHRTIELNKLEARWPPTRVEMTPHADFMGFEATIGTPVREAGAPVIKLVPALH